MAGKYPDLITAKRIEDGVRRPSTVHANAIGAENVVHVPIRNGAKKVIALSTDKAANAINVYGANKLASDKILIAANIEHAAGTRLSVICHDNVVGTAVDGCQANQCLTVQKITGC